MSQRPDDTKMLKDVWGGHVNKREHNITQAQWLHKFTTSTRRNEV